MQDIAKLKAAFDKAYDADLKQQGICTLGKLIALLEARPAAQEVIFDFCRIQPGRLHSYRGSYDQLAVQPNFRALRWDDPRYKDPITVGEFLAELKKACGATFTGYKGGDFVMGEDTPIWVDESDASTGTAILGLVDDNISTIIRTGHMECTL